MARLFLLLIVALGLAPGTWLRSSVPETPDERQILTVDRIRIAERKFGEIEVAGAWQLRSPNHHFHAYSALLPMDDGTLLALNDFGRMMRLVPPGAGRTSATFGHFAAHEEDKRLIDVESAARDSLSGTIWVAYERANLIERFDAELVPTGRVRPPEMRGWPPNMGPEAITRLADGRFVVLSEGSPRWFPADLPALLFPADPIRGARAERFRFRPPESYRPVDMAVLPDGRVLILLRRLVVDLPPRFEAKLVVSDPSAIRPGERWSWREIAHLTEPVPMDNYEGLAVEAGEGGRLVLWLISDDNKATFQRTLLLKLLWRPNEKARELPRAPS